MYTTRLIEEKIKKFLFQNAVIIIYGPRQSGKTTLVKKIAKDLAVNTRYLNCDALDVQEKFARSDNPVSLKQNIIRDFKLVIIDEAQKIKNIGIKLKMMFDEYPGQQIITTGSSSFDLANEIAEPLTGRNFEFRLHPLMITEIKTQFDSLEMERNLENILLYGTYPQVFWETDPEVKKKRISTIASDYLYRDALKFLHLKNADKINNLLQALAYQVGSEVSLTELANMLELHKDTVASYIELLIKSFVIFRLPPFSKNRRQELNRLNKIYFYDTGVRNAVIRNFNSLDFRDDIGKIWENFIVAEKVKRIESLDLDIFTHFWRTYEGAEIDFVEEKADILKGFEIKWTKPRKKAPKAWGVNYPNGTWETITRDNFLEKIA